MKFHLSGFSLKDPASGAASKNYRQIRDHWDFLLSARSLIVLWFTVTSMIPFELIFVKGII